MIGPSIRFQDFELDARARLTATATFSQAEVDAIRREAFATGQKEGAGNAATVIATARAEQAEALCDVVRQIEGLQHAIDQYLSESLDRFEQILRAALAHTLPSAASAAALQRLPDTLRQLAAAMPDVTVEAALSPETEDAIRSSAPRISLLRGSCGQAFAGGRGRILLKLRIDSVVWLTGRCATGLQGIGGTGLIGRRVTAHRSSSLVSGSWCRGRLEKRVGWILPMLHPARLGRR